MSHTAAVPTPVRDRADPPAGAVVSMPVNADDPRVVVPDAVIRRRADGSIDHAHYDRLARRLRARDQRAALSGLVAPLVRLIRAVRWRGGGPIRPGAADVGAAGARISRRPAG